MDQEIKAKANGFQKLSQDELNQISGGELDDTAKRYVEQYARSIKRNGYEKEHVYYVFSYHKELCAYVDEIWDSI